MKNKTLIITNIIILSFIIIALICFMIWGSFGNFNFWDFKGKLISSDTYSIAEVKKITSNLKSYDLEIMESDTSEIIVEVYGNKKSENNLKINNEGANLNIKQIGSTMCFGFCSTSKVIVYIPSNLPIDLDLLSISGEIEVNPDFINSNTIIKTTSGDIKANNLYSSTIKSTSGDIEISSINEGSIVTTSGDISIDYLKSCDIKSTSGEINITELSSGGTIKTTSGDIEIDRFTINENTFISSTSGEIEIDLLNEAYIDAQTKSGDKDIKKSRGEYELIINTTSGDITVR